MSGSESRQRTVQVGVRLTPDEMDRLTAAANARRIGVSEYLRDTALSTPDTADPADGLTEDERAVLAACDNAETYSRETVTLDVTRLRRILAARLRPTQQAAADRGDMEAALAEAEPPSPDVVTMTQREFDALLDYSCSLPTGQTIGKRWKRRNDYHDETKGWRLGEYVEHPDPNLVGIRWRDIEVRAAAVRTTGSDNGGNDG